MTSLLDREWRLGLIRSLTWNSNQKLKTLLKVKNLPMKTYLKKDSMFKLVLMQKHGMTTVLPFSKYASPLFAQKKPNGKQRLFGDLRKINILIKDDYSKHIQPVSTL